MKLQNLAIVFLVIAIPLILILSYYINLQRTTLELQTAYNDKLWAAAETAIQSFEINTVEWNEKYSEDSDSKRRDVQASVNSFITNLANNMGITGTSKEFMLNYIPAVIYTLSDGYYAYYKTNNAQVLESPDGVQLYYYKDKDKLTTDSVLEGKYGQVIYKAKSGTTTYKKTYTYTVQHSDGTETTENKEYIFTTDINDAEYAYEYTLKPLVKYSAEYKQGSATDIIVNYTMNNYISIYGQYNGDIVEAGGFLVYFDNNCKIPKINTINEGTITVGNKVSETQYSISEIKPETLTEQVYIKNVGIKEYKYIYNIKDEKVYYDDNNGGNFFTVSKGIRTDLDSLGTNQYRSISLIVPNSDENYLKLYQAISGGQKGTWYIDYKDTSGTTKTLGDLNIGDGTADKALDDSDLEHLGIDKLAIYEDCSAINYYVEAYAFTNFVKNRFKSIKIKDIQDNSITYSNEDAKIFDIGAGAQNPEDETSFFIEHKKEVMMQKIKQDLQEVIKGYSTDSKIPELSYIDWDIALNNVSIISYMQGIPIGLKVYNNYVVATSTKNKEFVSDYCINYSVEGDTYYHSQYCDQTKSTGNKEIVGYKNVDYVRRKFNISSSETIYYYLHAHNGTPNTDSTLGCYYCVINPANANETTDVNLLTKYKQSYYEALAREKYKQYEDIKTGIIITYDANLTSKFENGTLINHIISVTNVNPDTYFINYGGNHTIINEEPTAQTDIKIRTTDTSGVGLQFVGWTTNKNGTGRVYKAGDQLINIMTSTTLYAQWQVSVGTYEWKKDNLWKSSYGSTELFDPNNYVDSGRGGGQKFFAPGGTLTYINDGSISFIDIGDDSVRMTGNSVNNGKGAAWSTFDSKKWQYIDSNAQEFNVNINGFSFGYNIEYGDSFNAAGLIFNLVDSNPTDEHSGTLTGLMLSLNGSQSSAANSKFYSGSSRSNAAIWSFRYEKGKNNENVEKIELISPLNIPKSGNIMIKVNNNNDGYDISYGNAQIASINAETISSKGLTFNPNSFGFFSDHYSHNCPGIGTFELSNISITIKFDAGY